MRSTTQARTPGDLVGRTPLVALRHVDAPNGVLLFAKLEGQNPSGSIKDRIAVRLVTQGEASGALRPGMTLVEASTGNTAIALAMVARQRGYGLRIVLPHGVVPAVPLILKTLGVEIVWMPAQAGTKGAIDLARKMADEDPNVYAVGQFSNPMNITTHYETTGAEIVAEIDHVDVLVAGIGTGGTLMGVGRRLREAFPAIRVVGLEPDLGESLQGLRRIDDVFAAPLLDLDQLDGRWLVKAADALNCAKLVAEREGILVGVSSGAALHVALREARKMTHGGTIVMMFSDSGWKYLPAQPWEAAKAGAVELDDIHWW